MNMQFKGGENATPIVDEDDPARRKQGHSPAPDEETTRSYYKRRLKRSQDRANLPRYVGPEYTSVIRTMERFSLITHLIFLFRRKSISKNEYLQFISLGNAAILERLRRKKLLSDLDMN